MNFLSLVGVELKKIRRSKILFILLIPVIMMWIPSIINADMNFDLRGIPITPENNFFIQGFMGMVWFMIPASLVICTVRSLNNQISRKSSRPSVRSVAFSSNHPTMYGAKAKKMPSPTIWKIRTLGALAIHPATEPKRNTVASRLVAMEVNPTITDEISWNTSSIAMRGKAANRRGSLSSFFISTSI